MSMYKSDSIAQLADALSKAQAEMKAAEMNSVNPFLKNKYADLGSVIEAARQPLAQHGLSFTQLVGGDGGTVTLDTILLHSSGEYIGQMVSLPSGDDKGRSLAQSAGAVITYLRRYALSAILGIYADEDTDGGGNKPLDQSRRQEPPGQQQNGHAQAPTKYNPVTCLVEAGISENANGAAALLTKYVPANVRNDKEKLVAWGKIYRAWRDAGVEPEVAAQNATAGATL